MGSSNEASLENLAKMSRRSGDVDDDEDLGANVERMGDTNETKLDVDRKSSGSEASRSEASFVRSFVRISATDTIVSVARARSIQLGMSLIRTNLVVVPSGILTEESAQQGLGPVQHVPLAGKRIRPVTLFTLTRYAYLAQEKNPTP